MQSHARHGASRRELRPLSFAAKRLPLPNQQRVDTLLVAHLSLVACRTGQGSPHLLFELIHATYLSYLLWSQGYGNAEHSLFSVAERELDDAAREGYASNIWRIDESAVEALKPVLLVYDGQIEQVPVAALLDAKNKLKQLFGGKQN